MVNGARPAKEGLRLGSHLLRLVLLILRRNQLRLRHEVALPGPGGALARSALVDARLVSVLVLVRVGVRVGLEVGTRRTRTLLPNECGHHGLHLLGHDLHLLRFHHEAGHACTLITHVD